jgi:hypothetical protein
MREKSANGLMFPGKIGTITARPPKRAEVLCTTHADQHESSGDCKGSYSLIRARRAHRRSSATISTPMGVTLSPEQTAKIEEAGRPFAIL